MLACCVPGSHRGTIGMVRLPGWTGALSHSEEPHAATRRAHACRATTASDRSSPSKTPAISHRAGEHGLSLFKFGFTIEQVVHDYGDIREAVTELANKVRSL
jgi:hypothetical protein